MKTDGLGNPGEGPSLWTCGPSKVECRCQSPRHGGLCFARAAGPDVRHVVLEGP
jgi:hypothetical protein